MVKICDKLNKSIIMKSATLLKEYILMKHFLNRHPRGWRDGSKVKHIGALTEDLGSLHTTAVLNSSSRGSDALFWTAWVLGTQTMHIYARRQYPCVI